MDDIRLTEQVARRIAREFKSSSLRHAWTLLHDRTPLIDHLIVLEIRNAWVGDSTHGFTADEIMAFRKVLVAALAEKGWRE